MHKLTNVENRMTHERPEAIVTPEDTMKTSTMLTMARILTSTWKSDKKVKYVTDEFS